MKFITYSFKSDNKASKQLALSNIQANNLSRNEEFYLNADGEPLPWEAEAYYKSLKKKAA